MMTIDELANQLAADLDNYQGRAAEILGKVQAEGRTHTTPAEDAELTRLKAQRDAAKRRLDDARRIQAEEAELETRLDVRTPVYPVKRAGTGTEQVMRADQAEHVSFVHDGPVGRFVSTPVASSAAESRAEWVDHTTGRNAALSRAQRWQDHEVVREQAARTAERDRILTGTHGSLAQQIRAMSTTGASAVVPTIWAGSIIDKVRNKAVTLQAGVTVVPMPSKIYQIGRLTGDGAPAFKAEGAAVTASDQTFDFVQLQASTLSSLTVVSMEFLQDAINAQSVIEDSIAATMALEIDKRVLFGGFLTATGPEGFNFTDGGPKGVLKALLDNAAGNVLGSQTNGTAQTTTSYYNELINLVYSVKRRNERVTAIVSNDALAQQYDMAYDSQGRPLQMPQRLAQVPWLTTNAIPSFTQGTMTSRATDVFAGDWSQVLLGQRMGLEIRVLTERYAELGSVGILAYWRGDVALARNSAMGVYRYIQAAA